MPKEIINQIARQIELIRSRKMSSEGFIKLEASVRKLVMDSVSISKGQKKQKWASIHLNKNHYVSSRYQNELITYRIHVERAYHGMIELGYLRELKSGVNTPTVKYLTRYEATDKLVSLFKTDDLSSLAVTKPVIENPELIRVRLNIDGERRLVGYDESSQTRKMRENVAFINSVIARQWYDLELTDAEFLELEERMHQRSLERNEGDGRLRLHDRQLYRVFNSLSFDKGGRFYGGWWEGIPSEYRAKLLINGKRTEELDFSSLHPTILYAKHGLSLPKDAYEITLQPSSIPEGQSKSDFRKVVKRAFNAMLNAEIRLNTSPRNLNLHSWGIRWEELVTTIERKHELIAGEFFSGAGLELQYEDSQIAEEVMVTFAKQQGLVPLLPVHDSFICHHGYKRDVLKLMHDIFKARYGVNIEIKEGEQKIEHLYGVSEAGLDELLSYKDTSFEKRLDCFRQNNAR
jgi:hypothetical protein